MAPPRLRVRPRRSGCLWSSIAAFAGCLFLAGAPETQAAAPDSPEVRRAIAAGVDYLKQQVSRHPQSNRDGLFALALLKGGVPAHDPAVSTLLKRIADKFQSGQYKAVQDGWYEAACDIMAFEAADPVAYRTAIRAIAAQLVAAQNDDGGWNYPHARNTGGDMSVTQYAILGLWAAQRAGVDVPRETWDRAAAWLVASAQMPNGGFVYQARRDTTPKHSMTVAGVGSLYVCRMYLYPNAPAQLGVAAPEAEVPAEETPAERQQRLGIRWGVLEPLPIAPVVEEKPAEPQPAPRQPAGRARTPLVRIDQSIQAGLQWMIQNFEIENPTGWPNYYLYGLERMAALANLQRMGNRDWYDEGSTYFLSKQKADGSWYSSVPAEADAISASFVILFLSQSTRKTLNLAPLADPVGGGLLRGSRLPADLSAATIERAGEIKQVKLAGPFEELLAELAKGDANAAPAQQAIVAAVRELDREKLIGQKERLVELAGHSDADVRLTAIWALGRADDLDLVPLLLRALQDPNVDVNVEAHNALCFLSRKPAGVGIPGSPYAGLEEDATDVQRQQARDRWRELARARWTEWHFAVRPYAERNDLAEQAGPR